MNVLEQPWFAWSVGLTLVFPALVILMGELSSWLEQRGHALAAPLTIARNAVLPLLALQIFLFTILGASQNTIGGRLFTTVFWVVVIYASLSLLNALLFEQAAEDSWRANVPTLFRDLSRFILVLIGFAIIFSTVWDRNLGGLITALGVGSLVIGLALQDTLGNLFSGIAILFEQPYGEGDWIEVDGTIGQVSAINWRATRITTRDGDMVAIPNSVIASSNVLNESRPPGAGYEDYYVSFSYDDPPNKVKRVMLETIRTTSGVVSDPPTQVRTISYNDFSIKYQVRFAIEDFAMLPAIKDEFATRIWYAAKRNGLRIPFPIRTVFHYDGASVDQTASEEQLGDSLNQVMTLAAVEPAEDALVDEVALHHFGAGEQVLATGERADVLYSIVSGEVAMGLNRPTDFQEITRLTKGDVFGASSMLRGEPSSSSFLAISDVALVALSQRAVMQMVNRRPAFARELEEVIESRESIIQRARAELEVQA